MNKNNIIINLSRIGDKGTGLSRYSKLVVNCVSSEFNNVSIIAARSLSINNDVPRLSVPDWVTITQTVSKLRPILWLIYATFFLPKNERILSTTHHAVPGAKKQIISVLDLRPYFYPDSFLQKIYFRYILLFTAKKAEGIITISNESKKLIIDKYDIPQEKIFIVPLCVDVSKYAPKVGSSSNEPPYLLMVGATWRHKNAHELIENSQLWSHRYRLKIICGPGKYKETLGVLILKYGLGNKVDLLEYQSESKLISLYQNASVLVYPSLMEGFGIPPIESMACGIPVIVSDIPIFREIYGNVPIYVALGKPASWAAAFAHLDNQEIISSKIRDGLQKAKEYNEMRMCSALTKAIASVWPEIPLKPSSSNI